MSFIEITDANGAKQKVDVVSRTEGPDVVLSQATAVIDPTTGTPVDFATQTTLAALKNTADSIQSAAAAIQSAVQALNTKTLEVDTGNIAGVVGVPGVATAANQVTGNGALASIDGKLPALSGGRVPVELPAGGSGLTNDELRATPVPVSQSNAAQETGGNLQAIRLARW